MAQRKLLFKVIVVGDGGVGKSTMIQRLLTGRFIAQKITIGTDLATYDIPVTPQAVVKLQIWDFAGEKRFRFFLPNYSRGAYGVIICFDITRYTSFENLMEWFDIVSKNAADPIYVLVGGKADLTERRVIQREEAEEFKKANNIDYYFETSSLEGTNNYEIFKTLTDAIIKKKHIEL